MCLPLGLVAVAYGRVMIGRIAPIYRVLNDYIPPRLHDGACKSNRALNNVVGNIDFPLLSIWEVRQGELELST